MKNYQGAKLTSCTIMISMDIKNSGGHSVHSAVRVCHFCSRHRPGKFDAVRAGKLGTMSDTKFSGLEDLAPGGIPVLGIPYDLNSSYLRGPVLAPPRIREALFSESGNLCAENGIELGQTRAWTIAGDLEFPEDEDAFEIIEKAIADLLSQGARPVSLGGDHSITYPILRAFAEKYSGLNLLQFDAHPDLYDELHGNRLSHACPFARIMEDGLVKRLVQVGVRTINTHQREQAERFGVEVIVMRDLRKVERLSFDGALYLSFDLDCLDPAFAPGISHHEPGGMSTREALTIIQNLKADLVGADFVEYNPTRDPSGVTAVVAAKLLKELLGVMIDQRS